MGVPLPEWRERLRQAIGRSGLTHAVIAERAGVDPATLSRVLNGHGSRPGFDVVVRITLAAGESVAWLIGERDPRLTAAERATLLDAAEILLKREGWRVVYHRREGRADLYREP